MSLKIAAFSPDRNKPFLTRQLGSISLDFTPAHSNAQELFLSFSAVQVVELVKRGFKNANPNQEICIVVDDTRKIQGLQIFLRKDEKTSLTFLIILLSSSPQYEGDPSDDPNATAIELSSDIDIESDEFIELVRENIKNIVEGTNIPISERFGMPE